MPDENARFEIEFCSGPRDGETVAIRADEAVVGRGREVDIEATGDKDVAGRQVKIVWKDGRILVEDLGGSAVATVNGEAISTPREVADDDVVCVGRTEFMVRRCSGESAAEEVSVGQASRQT